MTPEPANWEQTPKQQLGRLLRRLRGDMLSMNVAEQIGISADLVSRIELGQRWPKPEVVRAWAAATGNGAAADELVTELAELRQLEARLRTEAQEPLLAQDLRSDLFRKASRVRTFAVTELPFYLQSADYARQSLGDAPGAADVVTVRRADNDVVGSGRKYFEIIVAESALRFLPCDPQAMRKQLTDLQGLVGAQGVEFGVIPFGVQLGAPLLSAFSVFGDVTVVESFAGAIDLTPKSAGRYAELMDRLWDDAVRGEEVRAILTAAKNALAAS